MIVDTKIKKDKESALWTWLKNGAASFDNHSIHLQRIEDTTKSGTPDVEGCLNSKTFWIELKVATEIKTKKAIRINTTAFQIFYAIKRHRAGGNSWYLIRVGSNKEAKHYLIPGYRLEENYNTLIPILWLENNSFCIPDGSSRHILVSAAIGEENNGNS